MPGHTPVLGLEAEASPLQDKMYVQVLGTLRSCGQDTSFESTFAKQRCVNGFGPSRDKGRCLDEKGHEKRLTASTGGGGGAGGFITNQSQREDVQLRDIGGKKSMIRRGYIILIIGGALFIAGIIIAAVWAIPFASTFLQNNTLINQVSIQPGRSVEATTQVTDVSRAITVAIHIERPQGVVRLIEAVKDPSGTIISSNEFSANLFTTFRPQSTGNHILNITNAGSAPVTINAMFGYMPFITVPASTSQLGGQPIPGVDLSNLSVIIVGGVLTTIGFFTIIAGIVIVVIDSRKRGEQKSGSRGGVTEGDITYRKD